MQYLGGKFHIAKQLCAYLESRRAGRTWIEPFCGGLNVTEHLKGERLACDANQALITLYTAVRAGWDPPDTVSESLYAEVKAKKDMHDPLTAFVGFGCSFGGKWFGGYARGDSKRNYAANARRALQRQIAACRDVVFHHADYAALAPESDDIVYADPPYAGTTEYIGVGGFDSDKFWEVVRQWTRAGAVCLVSEYTAPPDFKCVWEYERRLELQSADRARTERLFEYIG